MLADWLTDGEALEEEEELHPDREVSHDGDDAEHPIELCRVVRVADGGNEHDDAER